MNVAGISNLKQAHVLADDYWNAWDYTTRPSAIFVFSRTAMPRHRVTYSAAQLDYYSPAQHAKSIQVPVLLFYGEKDPFRVHGQAMNDALVAAGKKVEFIRFPGEDGSFSLSASRIALLNAVDKFLEKHIGKQMRPARTG